MFSFLCLVVLPFTITLISLYIQSPRKYELRPAVKKLYQLRPNVSTSRESVASRVINFKHDELRPAVNKEFASVASKDMGVQNVQQLECSYTVLLYFNLCTIICTRTELLNDTDNTVVTSCYSLMFKPS